MSSSMTSLYASFAIATAGAAGLAFTLTHPGAVAGLVDRLKVSPAPIAKVNADGDGQPAPESAPVVTERPGTVTLPAGQYGHFLTNVEINGRDIGVMVDTGASLVALTYDDAERVGIFVNASDFGGVVQTANGTARVARVTISRIRIGDITVRDVPAIVSERGALERTLLGMSFLGRLSRVEMRGSTLVLEE